MPWSATRPPSSKRKGGKVVGAVRTPLHAHGLLVVPAAGPGLQAPRSSASPMPAATRSTRSSRPAEFGIVTGGQKLAGLLVFVTDVHALGLQTAQGLVLTETFYWDLNDEHPRLVAAASPRRAPASMPTMRAGRRLWRDAALPEGRRMPSTSKDPAQVMAWMKANADRRSAVRQGLPSAPTAASCTRPTCSR